MTDSMLSLAMTNLNVFMHLHHLSWPMFRKWLSSETGGDLISDDVDIGTQIKLDLDAENHDPNMMCNISRLKSDIKMLDKFAGHHYLFIYNHFSNFAIPLTPYRTAEIIHFYRTGQEFSVLNRVDVLDIVLHNKYLN